ncbi:MAG: hypothetical protein IPJ40_04010 [Saprospirales bacterium]|nr:hypothetical protein [Saprospirales bacterium]
MEKNLPNDNLEKFLQKALEQYEENPSAGLWDKIEAGLPPAAAPVGVATKVAVLQKWAAGIAAILLIGFSVFQYLDHKAEITRLAEELNCTRTDLQNLREQTEAYAQLHREVQEKQNALFPDLTPPVEVVYAPQPDEKNPVPPANPAGFVTPRLAAIENILADFPGAPLIPFDALSLPFGWLPHGEPNLSGKALMPIKVFRKKTNAKISVGVQAGLAHTTYSRVKESGESPGHGQEEEHIKTVDKEIVVYSRSMNAGFTVNYGMGKNWSLESGLQYRRVESSYSHNPELKFGERKEHGGGPHGEEPHHFEYYLQSPSGTVYVSLSAEQTNPGEMISNQEELEVSITTKEKDGAYKRSTGPGLSGRAGAPFRTVESRAAGQCRPGLSDPGERTIL